MVLYSQEMLHNYSFSSVVKMPWELNIQNEISEVSKTSSTLSSCLLPVAASPACCLSPSWDVLLGLDEESDECFKTFLSSNSFHSSPLPPQTCFTFLGLGLLSLLYFRNKVSPKLNMSLLPLGFMLSFKFSRKVQSIILEDLTC